MNPTQGHLQTPDHLMLGGYFLLMLAIGVYFYRYMRQMKDFFRGGNTIPWWLSGVSFYMSSFSVAAFVFYPSLCYRHGWVGVTLLWVAIPATLFSTIFFARRWRRTRIDSPVEYLEARYSPLLRQLFAWQGVPVKIIDDGIKLFATGKFVAICTGLPTTWCILGAGGIMLLYTFMGGLWAVTVTDFIQFIVLTAAILVILPLSVGRAGGLTAIVSEVPDGFFRLTSPEFGWTYVIPLVMLYALAWSSINWSLIQKFYCVPTERDAVKTGLLVVALYIIGPPLMFFPAIAATRFMPGLADAGDVYPMLCSQLLSGGMLGLAIAAMFAATMSTLSGDYNVCASVLTNDVYKRLIRPAATETELVRMARIMTVVIGIAAMGAALLMARGKAENLFRIMVTLFGVATAPVAVPMLLGLVSRRYNNAGAIAGFVTGLGAGLVMLLLSWYVPAFKTTGFVWSPENEEIMLAGLAVKTEILFFLGTAAVTFGIMELTLLLWPAAPAERRRAVDFLSRLDAPVGSLAEDRVHAGLTAGISPFRVVGVCILAIGIMLLSVIPWMAKDAALAINLIIGVALLVMGALSVWAGNRTNA